MDNTYTKEEIDRIIKEIVNSGIYDFEKIFPKNGKYNWNFVGITHLYFENELYDFFKGKHDKIDIQKVYTVFEKILSDSGIFEKVFEYSNIWCEAWRYFKSENGWFHIHLDTTNDLADIFPIILGEDEWTVGFAMSNFSDKLVTNIVSAFEKHFGFKVYYKKEIIRDKTFGAYCNIYLNTQQFDC